MYPLTDEYEFEYDDEFEDENFEWEFESQDNNWVDAGDSEWDVGPNGAFDETMEMELAAELLGVADDEELEEFLGKLARRATSGVRRFARSRVGRALTQRLRGVARQALPGVGQAVGGLFGGPAGAAVGGSAASGLGRMFGLELEGLSPEDQEFEVARSFVRLAGDAAQEAAKAPDSMNPEAAASQAITIAARRHAPGLVSRRPQGPNVRSGRWERRGRNIVLRNV